MCLFLLVFGHMFLPPKVPGQGFAVNMLIYHRAFLAVQLKRHIADLAAGLSAVDR